MLSPPKRDQPKVLYSHEVYDINFSWEYCSERAAVLLFLNLRSLRRKFGV